MAFDFPYQPTIKVGTKARLALSPSPWDVDLSSYFRLVAGNDVAEHHPDVDAGIQFHFDLKDVPPSAVNPGYIYVARYPRDPGLIKIGLTHRSPEERLDELSRKTHSPDHLELLAVIHTPYARQVEKYLHKISARERYKGEFFEMDATTCVYRILGVLFGSFETNVEGRAWLTKTGLDWFYGECDEASPIIDGFWVMREDQTDRYFSGPTFSQWHGPEEADFGTNVHMKLTPFRDRSA